MKTFYILLSLLPVTSLVLWVLLVGEARPVKYEFAIFCVFVAVGVVSSGRQLIIGCNEKVKSFGFVSLLVNGLLLVELLR